MISLGSCVPNGCKAQVGRQAYSSLVSPTATFLTDCCGGRVKELLRASLQGSAATTMNKTMANFNLDDYIPVHERLQKFWEKYPEGRLTTEVIFLGDDFKNVVIKASAYRDSTDLAAATGIASEVNGEGYINKTSFIENAETSAVGRALANLGFLVLKGIASREEMQKVQRMQNEPPNQQVVQQPAVNQTGAVAQQAAPVSSSAGPPASDAQIRMLHALANGGDFNLELTCLERFHVEPEQLTKQQAMAFIDELKNSSAAQSQQQAQSAAAGGGYGGEAGATQAQLAAVAKIAAGTGVALLTMIEQEFTGITDPSELTKKQASHLIEVYGTRRS